MEKEVKGRLKKLRRMGSMEQLFTMLHPMNVEWGSCVSYVKINDLSKIPLSTLQKLWDKMHYKYVIFGCQYLITPNEHEFDLIYHGLPSSKMLSLTGNDNDFHEYIVKALNYRYLVLNDFNLNENNIETAKYDLNKIPHLYSICRYNDYLVLTYVYMSAFDKYIYIIYVFIGQIMEFVMELL